MREDLGYPAVTTHRVFYMGRGDSVCSSESPMGDGAVSLDNLRGMACLSNKLAGQFPKDRDEFLEDRRDQCLAALYSGECQVIKSYSRTRVVGVHSGSFVPSYSFVVLWVAQGGSHSPPYASDAETRGKAGLIE